MDALAHRHRRHEDLAVVGVAGEARQVVEELADVGADFGVRSEQPEVLVDARRLGVVVARADVAVVPHAIVLAAQHERGLRMRLEADDAVDDVHAHLFERAGPPDVRLLVEARLELDDGGHLFAVLGGLNQRLHDRTVAAGAVERLLDPEHGRVFGRLRHEGLDRGGERVVRVVHQHVALAQQGEELGRIVGDLGQPRGCHRCPGLAVQVGTVEGVDAPQPAQVQGARHAEDAVGPDLELGGQQLGQVLTHVCLDLEPEGLAEAASAQLHLNGDQQIVRLVLLEHEVGVAGHPEGVVVADGHAREQRVQVGGDDLLERDEALAVGHHHEAGQRRGHLDTGDAAFARRRVLHLDHQVEREVRDVGEGVPGVDGQRGEHGIDLTLEHVDQVGAVLVVERGPAGEADTRLGQGRHEEIQEDVVLAPDELLHPGPDHRELLARDAARRPSGCARPLRPGPRARRPVFGRTRRAARRRWRGTWPAPEAARPSSSARSSRRAPKSRRDCSLLVKRWYPKASISWYVGAVGCSTSSPITTSGAGPSVVTWGSGCAWGWC